MDGAYGNKDNLALRTIKFRPKSPLATFIPDQLFGDRMTFLMDYYNVKGKLSDCSKRGKNKLIVLRRCDARQAWRTVAKVA